MDGQGHMWWELTDELAEPAYQGSRWSPAKPGWLAWTSSPCKAQCQNPRAAVVELGLDGQAILPLLQSLTAGWGGGRREGGGWRTRLGRDSLPGSSLPKQVGRQLG